MNADPITALMGVNLHMSAEEARGLYAELYRTAADRLITPWPVESQIAELMRELAKVGADQ